MRLQLQRIAADNDSTVGALYIDCKPECFIVEDEYRSKKVFGETRIGSGSAEIILRKEGGHHERYLKKFPGFHVGMLCITNQPNWKLSLNGLDFQYILIHIGNDDDDTAGCLLTNSTVRHPNHGKGQGTESTAAYEALYKKVVPELLKGNKVFIDIYDEGQMF